jgi:hypothetical protein
MKQHEVHIFIDHKKFDVAHEAMTGTELRALPTPPFGPDLDLWVQVPGPGDDRKVGDDESVALKNGMHFYSAPRTINPGDRLPESDEAFLSEKGYRWEVIKQADGGSLILKEVRLAENKYDKAATDLMIRVPAGYPLAGLDMFYVEPPLAMRSGGYPQGAEQFEEHHGRRWQRFSRHLPAAWRPGVDGLRGFLALVMGELQGTR